MSLSDAPQVMDNKGRIKLKVRGEDQLFSIGGTVLDYLSAVISGADGYIVYTAVPAGQYWVITNVCARDTTTAVTGIMIMAQRAGEDIALEAEVRAFAAYERLCWSGHTFLIEDDTIAAQFSGGLVGDVCSISVSGYRITLET